MSAVETLQADTLAATNRLDDARDLLKRCAQTGQAGKSPNFG